jgi:hypothetical protein
MAGLAEPVPLTTAACSVPALAARAEPAWPAVASSPRGGQVGIGGRLRLAPLRGKHVDCVTGEQVLAAGEVLVAREVVGGR